MRPHTLAGTMAQRSLPVQKSASQETLRSHLVDGFIAYTLGPATTKHYLSRVLNGADVDKLLPVFYQNVILFSNPPLPNVAPYTRLQDGTVLWLLDYMADVTVGTIVPQRLCSGSAEDRVQTHANTSLQPPIFFARVGGVTGVLLTQALSEASINISGSEQPVSLNDHTTINFAMNWPGYSEYRRTFETQDSIFGQITTGKLLRKVAQFIDSFVNHPGSYLTKDLQWQVTPTWRDHILVVGIMQISHNTWQPILQLHKAFRM